MCWVIWWGWWVLQAAVQCECTTNQRWLQSQWSTIWMQSRYVQQMTFMYNKLYCDNNPFSLSLPPLCFSPPPPPSLCLFQGTSLTFRFLPPQERLQVLDLYWWIDFKLILSFDDYTLVICARQWIIYSYYPYGNPHNVTLFKVKALR